MWNSVQQAPQIEPKANTRTGCLAPCTLARWVPQAPGVARVHPTLVAQKATLDLHMRGALREVKGALQEDVIKAAAPDDAQALINMVCSSPALHPGNTTVPQDRITADKLKPGRQGTGPRTQRVSAPVRMHQIKITNNQGRPATATSRKVVKQP